MKVLTMRQWTVLTYIQDYMQRKGIPPTGTDIKFGCGLYSSAEVTRMLLELSAAGVVVAHDLKRRILVLTDAPVVVRP
jgi:SOS-response transcriptional repressor LexA